ncbi:MAG: DNA photolyase family protein [Actinomycetota bacterium]|nr:DNA photolyase family protein [Actinomycetota bacterium]
MSALVWFRRDLRVHDHPALRAAADESEPVVPVFCLDERLLGGPHASGPRTQFMLECLDDLDAALRDRGSGLALRRGNPERELLTLARELGAEKVHFSADVGSFARGRDSRIAHALAEEGIEAVLHPGIFAVDNLHEIRTGAGTPYTVFTPFYRSWLAQPRRELAPTPRTLPPLPSKLHQGKLPRLEELGLRQEVQDPAPGGERAAREAMSAFLNGAIADYEDGRDELHGRHVSRLSPYLHFGCISARELEYRLPAGQGAEAYRRQLCWRDFYGHVLRHFPENAHTEYQERYRGKIDWSDDKELFQTWCEGRTGFPLVDAGMRQLHREGWLHNRARLVVGSFLTKDLGIDWRWGERWFMRLLIDGDQASNNGNWQWIASVGVDPQPVFRRIFNPARQQARFDAGGEYVRRYVPELRDVPDEFLAEPWTMPPEVQREAGCVIGQDYPGPIVDHAAARREALQRYATAG